AAAASTGTPARIAADAPTPASTTADGDVIASAIARGRLRSMRGSINSEVRDHGREDLVDARRVARVVRRRVGGLGDAPEHTQVGGLAIADGEDAYRTRCLPLVAVARAGEHVALGGVAAVL